MSYAMAWQDGRLLDHYYFRPDWFTAVRPVESFDVPGIFLFSNYVWSHEQNLRVSARLKEQSPGSVMIHGGPDSPKYPGDVERYFEANPHIDVVVHGEGEATTAEVLDALVGRVGDGLPDLEPLREIPGLSVRI